MSTEELNVFYGILSTLTTRNNVVILDVWTSITTLFALSSIALKDGDFYMFRYTLRIRISFEFNTVPFPHADRRFDNGNCQCWISNKIETSTSTFCYLDLHKHGFLTIRHLTQIFIHIYDIIRFLHTFGEARLPALTKNGRCLSYPSGML